MLGDATYISQSTASNDNFTQKHLDQIKFNKMSGHPMVLSGIKIKLIIIMILLI